MSGVCFMGIKDKVLKNQKTPNDKHLFNRTFKVKDFTNSTQTKE